MSWWKMIVSVRDLFSSSPSHPHDLEVPAIIIILRATCNQRPSDSLQLFLHIVRMCVSAELNGVKTGDDLLWTLCRYSGSWTSSDAA